MRVLLIGNYAADRQQSMLRFGALLESGLRQAGLEVNLVRPEPVFGKMIAGTSGIGKWAGYLDKFVVFPARLRRIALPYDLSHICDHSNAPMVGAVENMKHLVTCHDLLAVRSALGEFPQNPVRWSGRILQRLILGGLRRAKRIVADSRATMRDLARLLPAEESEIPVIHPGLNPSYYRENREPTAGPGYMVHVGGDQWYKNREGLLRIYAEIRNRMCEQAPDLVIVGPSFDTPLPGIRFEAGASDARLRTLYSDARLLLFPSFAEGYGWPVIEALACGCPVVSTGRAPMTEIAGDVAVYFDDPDAHGDAAAAAIHVLREQPAERERRIAAGIARAGKFSVEAMADRYIEVYRTLLTGKP